MLCLPPSLCRELTAVVTSKTAGLMLFILRFFSSLKDEGLIWYSRSTGQWMYDLPRIRLKEPHGDVVTHMTEVNCGVAVRQSLHLGMQPYLLNMQPACST